MSKQIIKDKKPDRPKVKLSTAEKKKIAALIRQAKGDGKKHTAQQTIPYEMMYPDGICRLAGKLYSKSIEFFDINYQLAQPDDKTATFEALCDFYNSLDSSIGLQLTFVNRVAGKGEFAKSIEIPPQGDGFDDVRTEYAAMLQNQLAKASLETIRSTASELIAEIDRNFAELTKTVEQEKGALPEKETAADKDTYTIYQLKDNTPVDYHFRPLDELQAKGLTVTMTNYEAVYTAPIEPGTGLEDIYTKFNIDHSEDFKGHSLSVSDVVVLHQNGQDTAHYVDSYGFQKVPEFTQPENHLKTAEQSTEQNANMIDGQINNTPSVDELEAKVKAGEQISLVDLAEAIKNDKATAKNEPKKPGRKPSIRKQLKEDKENAKKEPKKQAAKTKNKELEV